MTARQLGQQPHGAIPELNASGFKRGSEIAQGARLMPSFLALQSRDGIHGHQGEFAKRAHVPTQQLPRLRTCREWFKTKGALWSQRDQLRR